MRYVLSSFISQLPRERHVTKVFQIQFIQIQFNSTQSQSEQWQNSGRVRLLHLPEDDILLLRLTLRQKACLFCALFLCIQFGTIFAWFLFFSRLIAYQ